MIEITCQGDHNWSRHFDTEAAAYDFLYALVGRRYTFYRGANAYHDQSLIQFDIEDDLMTWKQGRTRRYCAGWHHANQDQKAQIVLPDGTKLVDLLNNLQSSSF